MGQRIKGKYQEGKDQGKGTVVTRGSYGSVQEERGRNGVCADADGVLEGV